MTNGTYPDIPELLSKDVSIWSDSCHWTGHVFVDVVDLLRVENLVKKFVGVTPLGSQKDAVIGQDPEAGTSMTDSFHGIFNLLEGKDTLVKVAGRIQTRENPWDGKSVKMEIQSFCKM